MKYCILLFIFSFALGPILAQDSDQSDNQFRYGSIHKVNERASYSVFYPIGATEIKGMVILIHSSQASNPNAYGAFIETLLKNQYIVIYPSYQSYLISGNKHDTKYITKSLVEAYKDVKKNYPNVLSLPVAFIGHSMGGIIAYELATGVHQPPKKPSCIISLAPAEVNHHEVGNLNFKKLDNYDVYLIIEEENDRHYKKGTGKLIFSNLENANRRRYFLHQNDKESPSKHMNAWSYNDRFSSTNNGAVSYFGKQIGQVNSVDTDVYWPQIQAALECAFSRKGCDDFRQEKENIRTGL